MTRKIGRRQLFAGGAAALGAPLFGAAPDEAVALTCRPSDEFHIQTGTHDLDGIEVRISLDGGKTFTTFPGLAKVEYP